MTTPNEKPSKSKPKTKGVLRLKAGERSEEQIREAAEKMYEFLKGEIDKAEKETE